MTVYLVGAGPGDRGLMTARALELIARADVILYDRLIPAGALDGARPEAELIFVGKQGGGEQIPQVETNRLLLERAAAGLEVVRVKGGDPFVFGRGGEEARLCRERGIAVEVVPGVTAGIAAPAYSGIPVTHRSLSSAVAFITGHEDPAKPASEIDWPALAAFPGTLVFYMGVRALPRIAERLIASGRPPEQLAAVIERGTLPGQRSVTAPLSEIAARAQEAAITAPAVTVIGDVAALGDQLGNLGPTDPADPHPPTEGAADAYPTPPPGHTNPTPQTSPTDRAQPTPLAGRTVAVTRARPQASALAQRLRALGATVIEAPAIRTEPLYPTLPDLASFDLLCLTSPTGVDSFFERLATAALDARALAGLTIAAIGPGTANALAAHSVRADIVPERAVSESLADALAQRPLRRALIARASEGRDVLPAALRERGAEVKILALYETVAEMLDPETAHAAAHADFITFTSASTVRHFLAALPERERAIGLSTGTRIASIGPATSAALRAAGLEPAIEADPHTPDGLVEALATQR